MRQIYIEVPKETNVIGVNIPCGEGERCLWEFTVMFQEAAYLNERYVSIRDKDSDGDDVTIQSLILTPKTRWIGKFEYHLHNDYIQTDVTFDVVFTKETKFICVKW